ncbi:MAG TPA: MBL fold metallo-hydrolase, partial [Archaeoglobus profundus]|nr:MBL fold metallo-hydrolase [Archaeoglobus profundus]
MKDLEVLPYVKIYVLNDNYEYDDYLSDWGIAFLIVTPYDTFLFDTGPSAYTLLFNSEKLGLKINDVKFIIISHDHADHVGGLEGLSWYLK